MDRTELKQIVLNPDKYSAEEYQAAVKAYYPFTEHAPPRLPPDNSPTPDQVLRYPRMHGAAKVAEAKATLEKAEQMKGGKEVMKNGE